MVKRRCSDCGKDFVDTVSEDEHSRGESWQETEVNDIPTLCVRCNELRKGKA